jgi:hypothetical protein
VAAFGGAVGASIAFKGPEGLDSKATKCQVSQIWNLVCCMSCDQAKTKLRTWSVNLSKLKEVKDSERVRQQQHMCAW